MNSKVVHFFSDGYRIEADYYLPKDLKPGETIPGLVLCGGYGAVRSLILPDYAAHFVAAGYAVCAPDYRGFGGSEGDAARIMPHEQIEDIRAAITWISIQSEVDPERIGVWGTSGGGAHAVQVAGIESRAKCAVGQVGYADGSQLLLDRRTEAEREEFLAQIKADREARVTNGESGKMRVIDLLSDRATYDFVLQAAKSDPSIISYVTLESADATLDYKPIDVIHHIGSRALMLIGADKDELCIPTAFRRVLDKATGPTQWVSYPIGHYEIYGPDWLKTSANAAIDWYKRYL